MKGMLAPVFGLVQMPEVEPLWRSDYSYLLFQHSLGFPLALESVYLLLDGNGSVAVTVRRGNTRLGDSLPVSLMGRGFYRFHFTGNININSGQEHRLYLTPVVSVAVVPAAAVPRPGLSASSLGVRIGNQNMYDLYPLIGFVANLG